MSKDFMRAIEITREQLAKAEADLAKCGRGSNHGRVAALRELLTALLLEATEV